MTWVHCFPVGRMPTDTSLNLLDKLMQSWLGYHPANVRHFHRINVCDSNACARPAVTRDHSFLSSVLTPGQIKTRRTLICDRSWRSRLQFTAKRHRPPVSGQEVPRGSGKVAVNTLTQRPSTSVASRTGQDTVS